MSEQSVTSLKCLVLDDSVIYAEAIKQMLVHEPGMELHNSHTGFGEGLRAARKLRPDVILIAGDTPGVASTVEALDNASPDAPIIVLFDADEPQLARECILAGAQLCLYNLEDREELITAIRRLVTREKRRRQVLMARASSEENRLARIIAFHGSKGGVGTTTLAVNAAVALAQLSKKRVALVDGSMQAGDVGVLLDINHMGSITDLIPHMKDLDYDLMKDVMARHESGVQVLLAPADIERAELVSTEQFNKVLRLLRKHVDYIIIDTPPSLDTISMAALDTADQIVLVTMPEVTALRNTARFMQLAAKLGYPAEKLFLLLNRAGSKGGVSCEDIKQHLKHEIGLQIRSAGRALVAAGNKGIPAAMSKGRMGPAKSFRQLAMILDMGERESKRQQRARRAAWLTMGRNSAKGKAEQPAPGR